MWRIIIIKDKDREEKTFKEEDKAIAYFEKMQKKYADKKDVKVYKISVKNHIPLDEKKEKPKQRKSDKSHPLLWCPYCGDWRNFRSNHRRIYACPVCTITTKDFYVKSINHLW